MRRIWCGIACSLIVLGLVELRQTAATAEDAKPIVWLVRHGEKGKEPVGNEPLTDKGKKRAEKLAGLLSKEHITAIIASDRERTIDTATPTSKKLNVPITKEPDVDAVVGILRQTSGNTLVVHHSNTVPKIINKLRDPKAPQLSELKVFNRIFILELNGKNVACRETTYENFEKKKAC